MSANRDLVAYFSRESTNKPTLELGITTPDPDPSIVSVNDATLGTGLGEVKRANLSYQTVDHSAIFVLSQHTQPTEDILFENIKIADTPNGVAQMRLINYQGGIHRVEFKGITITGANNWFFAHHQVADSD